MHHQHSIERASWHSVGYLRTTDVVHGENNRGDDIALPCIGAGGTMHSDARDGYHE